jgi:hypothetical protein
MRRTNPFLIPAMIASLTVGSVSVIHVVAIVSVGQAPIQVSGDFVDRSFGHLQLDAMLVDRPDMANLVPPSHRLMERVVDGFGGKWLGHRVYWRNHMPTSGRPAEHQIAFGTSPAHVVITAGAEISPIDRWTCLVFEFYNLENSKQFLELEDLAYDGILKADEYSERCNELEFRASKKTHKFFRENPLPQSEEQHDKYYNWITSDFGTFEEYKIAWSHPISRNSESNFVYFRDHYFNTIVPHRAALRREKKSKFH